MHEDDGGVIAMWAEACNKYYKGQYSKCQEILKDTLVGGILFVFIFFFLKIICSIGQSDPLDILIPLLNNNRIVCQSQIV